MAATTISVSKEFQNWLKGKGKKGEGCESTIRSLTPYTIFEGKIT